jgi:hypothetical protein
MWFMALSITFISIYAWGVWVILVYRTWRAKRAVSKDACAEFAEVIIANGEFIDARAWLLQVSVLLMFGLILVLAIAFGTLNLEGPAGVLVALCWIVLPAVGAFVGRRKLYELGKLRAVLRERRKT